MAKNSLVLKQRKSGLFGRFKKGTDNVEDLPRFGWRVESDDESLKSLDNAKPQLVIDEIAEKLNSSHGTIYRHLHGIGKMTILKKWVPHQLSEENRQYRINVHTFLLSRQYQGPFLDRIVMGYEKWILY